MAIPKIISIKLPIGTTIEQNKLISHYVFVMFVWYKLTWSGGNMSHIDVIYSCRCNVGIAFVVTLSPIYIL
jgi:hypothetical protein